MPATPAPLLAMFSMALVLAGSGPAQALANPPEIRIQTSRDGEFVTVAATADMQVDPRVAWDVLSDYDHLADFIPDMKSSRVVSRSGNSVRVEQKGEFGFLFYQQPVDVTLEVLEIPRSRITARSVDGNVRELETRYELENLAQGVRLNYHGRFIPEFSVPPLIGMPFVRRVVDRRFRAMVTEIVRRDALAGSAAKR
jgi:ribosome-associated toxin RatA of RatAB toxin-antitoxin module